MFSYYHENEKSPSKLSQAIREKRADEVAFLLETGECSSVGNHDRYPPIIECLLKTIHEDDDHEEEDTTRCEILKLLVHYGAGVNVRADVVTFITQQSGWRRSTHKMIERGMTAAMCAATRGYLRCLKFLVKYRADLNIATKTGETALIYAVKGEQTESVSYLASILSPNAIDSRDSYGKTALMHAVSNPSQTSLECMKQLIAAGADLEVTDAVGHTALMLAVVSSKMSADHVTVLLEHGASVDRIRRAKETSLTIAIDQMLPRTVAVLLRFGADPTLSRRHGGCLHRMVRSRKDSVVRALVSCGMPPLDANVVTFDLEVAENGSRYKNNISAGHMDKLACYLETTDVSPLAVALLYKAPNTARYLIANQFFTRFDVERLCRDPEVRQLLQTNNAKDSLEILDFLSARPHSLLSLSLVAVSSALTQDYLCSRFSANESYTSSQKHILFARPTFIEKVGSLGLPPPLQRLLLHDTSESSIETDSWSDIPLTDTKIALQPT